MNILPQSRPGVRAVILRSLLVGLVYALVNALAAAMLGSMSRLAPTLDNLWVWFLTGTLTCLALSSFILHSNGSHARTMLAIWAGLALVRSLGLGLEGALFQPTAAVNTIAGAALDLLVSLLVAWLSVILLLPAHQVPPAHTQPQRSGWGWTGRVLAVGLAYFVFNLIFGTINEFLFATNLYKNYPQCGLSFPPEILLAELLRGLLLGLGSLCIARVVSLPRRQVGVWLGILLFVVGGATPYVEVTLRTLSLELNLATLAEIFLRNFLTGMVAAYLYGTNTGNGVGNMRKLRGVLALVIVTLPLVACWATPTPSTEPDDILIYQSVIRRLYAAADPYFSRTSEKPMLYIIRPTPETTGDPAKSRVFSETVQPGINAALADLPTTIIWVDRFDQVSLEAATSAVRGKGVIITLGNIHYENNAKALVFASTYYANLRASGKTYVVEKQAWVWTITCVIEEWIS